MNDDFYVIWDGEEISDLENELTDEELKQLEEDALLDGKPEIIPNWSKQYNGDK